MTAKKRDLLEEITKREKNDKRRGKKLFIIILFLLVLGLAVAAGYYWYKTEKNLKSTQAKLDEIQRNIEIASDPAKQAALVKEETQKVIDKLSKHIILPTGEDPLISVISDIDKLSSEQPFYKGAANGDYILIYKNAKQGIVYDPVNDVIVKVGTVADTTTSPDTSDNSANNPADNSTVPEK